jgi:hypothetical protein
MTGAPGGPTERTFTGGLCSAAGNAIWPLARLVLLDLGDPGAGQRSRAAMAGPGVGGQVGELTGEQPISARIASRGVYVQTANPAGSVVFWSRWGTDILDHLQVHGVPADRSVTRLPWGGNAYHP